MAYTEFIPVDSSLHPFIECFWISSATAIRQPVQRILPDGCTDIIYRLPTLRPDSAGPAPASMLPMLVGTMTRPLLSSANPTHDFLGIRFKPGGLPAFIPVPLRHLTDRIGPVDGYFPKLGSIKQTQLNEVNNWSERLLLLEDSLLQIAHPATRAGVAITAVVELLQREKGQVSLSQLSQQGKLTPRQLERLFQHYVGVSPKLLARIVRFRHVRTVLDSGSEDSLMGIAFDTGYTDHAHLTKEFKLFAGLTPSAYRL